jgi:hypothetical protein
MRCQGCRRDAQCRRIEIVVQECDHVQCWRRWVSKQLCAACRRGLMALLEEDEVVA